MSVVKVVLFFNFTLYNLNYCIMLLEKNCFEDTEMECMQRIEVL
jgi:hypothetical protein